MPPSPSSCSPRDRSGPGNSPLRWSASTSSAASSPARSPAPPSISRTAPAIARLQRAVWLIRRGTPVSSASSLRASSSSSISRSPAAHAQRPARRRSQHPGVDIGASIAACSDLLIAHGGHPGAAGVPRENVDRPRSAAPAGCHHGCGHASAWSSTPNCRSPSPCLVGNFATPGPTATATPVFIIWCGSH